MKALLLIAKDNIKKKKTNAIIMTLLIAIATMFLYVGISVIGNMSKVIDDCNEENHGADFLYYTESEYYQDVIDILCNQEHVTESQVGEFIFAESGSYGKEMDFENKKSEAPIIIERKDDNRTISKINVIDSNGEWGENCVILPYFFHVGNGYEVGDTFVIEVDGVKTNLKVCGFSQDVMFANTVTITVIKIIVSDDVYEKYAQGAALYRGARLRLDGYDSEQFDKEVEGAIQKLMDEKEANATNYHVSLNYAMLRRATGITVTLFMGILTIFAVLLIFVVLIIIRFNIGNSIEENIKNIGIMEACGYTSKQMIHAVIAEFSILGIAGCTLGLAAAGACSKAIGNIVSASMGLLWSAGFSIISAIVTVVLVLTFIVLIARISARKYKIISPLDALRNGIHSHNFKKNSLKLEKSPLPLNTTLGIKSILFNLKKRIFICFVIVILTFVTCTACALFKNFRSLDIMLPIVGVEYADLEIGPKDISYDRIDQFVEELEAREEVNRALKFTNYSVVIAANDEEDQLQLTAYEDPSKMEVDVIAKGRMPIYENEVALSTLMCKQYGLDIGDAITLKMGRAEADYMIVGKNQGTSNLGKTCIVTFEGHKRINPDQNGSGIYVYLNEGVDVDQTVDLYRELYGDTFNILNFSNLVDNVMQTIIVALNILCSVLIAVSAFVIAMILLLLIKSHIIREKKQFGIYKAIGYTTPQLMVQIAISYLPVVLLGGIVGGILTKLLLNKLFVLCFSMFSIEKIVIELPVVMILLSILGIVVWSGIITVLASVRTRKIAPYKMITEA